MWTWMRRLFGLALLGGGAYAAYSAWQRRTEPAPDGPPEWPPLREAAPAAEQPGSGRTWVEPVDDSCPDGFPIKANANSGIYHVPGGRFYNRTVPERCYADEAGAEADGYRRAKA